MSDNVPTHATAARVIVGHCPSCGRVHVFLNNYETWDAAACECGTFIDTTSLVNYVRRERNRGVER